MTGKKIRCTLATTLAMGLMAMSGHAAAFSDESLAALGFTGGEELVPVPEKPLITEEEFLALHGPVKSGADDLSRSIPEVDKSSLSITSPVSAVEGALSGRIVYLMGGHGWTYSSPNI